MKKRGILISVGIIAVALGAVLFLWQSKGYIALETPGAELYLRTGLFTRATVRTGSGPREVPARVYAPSRLRLTRTKDGDTWQLESRGPWGELARIKVESGRTTTVKFGPPLLIRPEVRLGGGQVSVDLSIIGQAGETYRNVITKNNRMVSEPEVKIIDPSGTVLASGRFKYG